MGPVKPALYTVISAIREALTLVMTTSAIWATRSSLEPVIVLLASVDAPPAVLPTLLFVPAAPLASLDPLVSAQSVAAFVLLVQEPLPPVRPALSEANS